MDFKELYPENAGTLLNNWSNIKKGMIKYVSQYLKDDSNLKTFRQALALDYEGNFTA